MNTPSLGQHNIDLAKLLETRLMIQAQSGGGKSWALRRLCEQLADQVQQLIIDPEGELQSLRERYDYIICAPSGADAVANIQTAALLARRLWESGASAIINISDLKRHEQRIFVQRFFDALIGSPKKIWHPTLVVLDEAHVYAPQTGKAESRTSVEDMASRGRKRGLCLVPATQRLSKLSKDVAAECWNKAIGRTGLPADAARAGDELGMTKAEAMDALRDLQPGEFYVFGPALANGIEKTRIGDVQTTHPQAGQKLASAPPPPSDAIKSTLAKLEDLQREAEDEARTVEELQQQVATLKSQLTRAEKRAEQSGIPEREAAQREDAAYKRGRKESWPAVDDGAHEAALRRIAEIADQAITSKDKPKPARRDRVQPPATTNGPGKLRKGAVKILSELAARHPAGYSKAQVGALTGYSHKGGTFNTYLSDLRGLSYIEERDGLIFASDAGIEALGDDVPEKPRTHAAVMAMWQSALRAGAYRMLEAIVESGDQGIDKRSLAEVVDMTASGGTFNTYLSDLRRNGLIHDARGHYTAQDILFPQEPQS